MARVLLLGARGQLGVHLSSAAPAGWTVLAPGREEVDLAAPNSLVSALDRLAPDAIINAAAYTAVDKAEQEPALAFAINRDGPAALAAAAAARRLPLVHVSTDYVFAGDKTEPYVEDDPVGPRSVYGASKAEGERGVLNAGADAAIVRTSWVFSAHGQNFVKTMLRLGAERSEVSVVADQHGRPTFAKELGHACIFLTERLLQSDAKAAGVFHFAGAGEATWAEFAEAIFDAAAKRGRAPVRVRRISTAEYPTAAPRPANSRLSTAKIEALGATVRPWRSGLAECLDQLLGSA